MMKLMATETPEDRAALLRISAAIGGLDAAARPRADWKARVMASVRAEAKAKEKAADTVAAAPDSGISEISAGSAPADAATATKRPAPAAKPPWWTRLLPMGLPFAGACAAVALLVVVPRGDAPVATPRLLVELEPARVDVAARDLRASGDAPSASFRGDAPVVGSRVRVTAESSAKHRALWVFLGRDELVLQCPGAGCTAEDERVIATLQVGRVGEYAVVALSSSEPLPKPPDTLDAALALVARNGVAQLTERFTVW